MSLRMLIFYSLNKCICFTTNTRTKDLKYIKYLKIAYNLIILSDHTIRLMQKRIIRICLHKHQRNFKTDLRDYESIQFYLLDTLVHGVI
jgi:hypothetical protein